ncbi:DUF1345 domain-containing protein [Glacieibacterium frigidum]|uniref:DUF1345 domain-containing protein n=1 Tax=Glacieibacterium frigidum TaxID=2593303 RepID=A0A552UID4_9SPHN|nr:DUF1345 domain-containing protein [Glacieibacterium frigidum]TRW17951.1 DUF1345 domain-containing protein [Glacieibacterium frigidum]
MNLARRYARFVLFFAVFAAATAALALRVDLVPAILGGFDIAVAAFLIAFAWSLGGEAAEGMRRRAAENEPDHLVLLLIAAVVVAVVVVAVGFELTTPGGGNLALSGGTLFAAWLFGNLLFAFHYAHAYYLSDGKRDRGGLDFPGDADPTYWDFAYFAFVLGMTFQVSDVSITARGLRRVALIHSLIAFWFNLAVIALTVSLVGETLK